MNIQIFGTLKCQDTKKAQRYFKERRINFQFIDMTKKSISPGELKNIKSALKMKADDLIRTSGKPDPSIVKYLASEDAKDEKLIENPLFLRTPIVRNGRKATLGYEPETWKKWEDEG